MISVFLIRDIWGYIAAFLFLAFMIRGSHVPVKFMVRGLKGIFIILIFTDGYAAFPEEDAAMDIPVVWLILDSPVEPPWGNTIHLYTDGPV